MPLDIIDYRVFKYILLKSNASFLMAAAVACI